MINESSATSNVILPATYSDRVKGRAMYRGRELLARSGATTLGPTMAVSKYASTP